MLKTKVNKNSISILLFFFAPILIFFGSLLILTKYEIANDNYYLLVLNLIFSTISFVLIMVSTIMDYKFLYQSEINFPKKWLITYILSIILCIIAIAINWLFCILVLNIQNDLFSQQDESFKIKKYLIINFVLVTLLCAVSTLLQFLARSKFTSYHNDL